MQQFTPIPDSLSLQASRLPLVNNDLTAISCNSGTAFPTSNLIDGMLCLRTDQLKLYQCLDIVAPVWKLIFDLSKTATDKEYVDAGLATKQNTISGAASSIASNNLAVSRALVSDASGKVGASAVTATELGHLSGVTAGVQSQLNDRVINSRTLTGGTGIDTIGDLSANRTINLTNIAAGSATVGALSYNGTTQSAGRLYGGTADPTSATRLNYDGHFHATAFVGDGSGLTNLPVSDANGALRATQVYTSSGTWTKPEGLKRIKVTVVGGGAGGGASTSQYYGGGGGGGGGMAAKVIEAVDLGETETVTVGGGGGSAGNGGTSSFGIHCSATGGGAGGGNSGLGGLGGVGSGGDLNINGDAGHRGGAWVFQTTCGSVGYATACWVTRWYGGQGGGSKMGAGGRERNSDGNGNTGRAYGGGGGGAYRGSTTNRSGGAGVAGVIIVEEYY